MNIPILPKFKYNEHTLFMNKTTVICTTLLVEKSPQALPLGAACITSAIKHAEGTKDRCDAKLICFSLEDDEIKNKPEDKTIAFITEQLLSKLPEHSKENPAIVCFSVFVWNRTIFEKVSSNLQKKGIITIAGGPEITAHPFEIKAFDYVTSGEGEQKVPVLIEKILNCEKNLPKVMTVSPDNNISPSVPLEQLHSVYLDGTLDPSEYGGALWELARGCPFKCSYCYESKGEKTVRNFPMERIEKELDLFAKKKIPQVFVLDPTYNINRNRALEILKLIEKKTPDTFYYFEARAEFIDRQMAKAFTKIPCALQIGLQSANENVLKLVNRPFNKKQFVRNIGFLNEEGVIFGFDLIYGLPGETIGSFREGIDFAISLYPNNLEIFCLSVLPGTDLFDKAKSLNLTYEENPPYHIIHTDKFSVTDISTAGKLAKACSVFYNSGRAVPWFNTILKSLKMRASTFFEQFEKYMDTNKIQEASCTTHKQIEKLQIDFVTQLYKQKHLDRFINAATDIIRFNGAISRKTDTGISEKVTLSYPADYIDSEYSLDLQFFVANVRPGKNTVTI